MATIDQFRKLACTLPEAVESSHMGTPDFRVGGRIFATLYGESKGRGVLKLTPEQQADFVAERPETFEPVQGGWGRNGMTFIILEPAEQETLRDALATAYRNVAGKKPASRPAPENAALRTSRVRSAKRSRA